MAKKVRGFYICPWCMNPTLAMYVGKYIILTAQSTRPLMKHKKTPVVCLTAGCGFTIKRIGKYLRNWKKLHDERPLKEETPEQRDTRFERQNTFIAITNWIKKLGLNIPSSAVWALLKDEEMFNMLKRPYWRKDDLTCTYLLYYLMGEEPNCKITKEYLLREPSILESNGLEY